MARHPGRLPQTSEGSDVLEIGGRPASWARRLLGFSLGFLLAAVLIAIVGFLVESARAPRSSRPVQPVAAPASPAPLGPDQLKTGCPPPPRSAPAGPSC